MADFELVLGRAAEDHLWTHGLYPEDAFEVFEERQFKNFPDGGHGSRRKIVGIDKGGRLLTIAIDLRGRRAEIITGWPADAEEQALYSRAGGSQYV